MRLLARTKSRQERKPEVDELRTFRLRFANCSRLGAVVVGLGQVDPALWFLPLMIWP